jgi:hypothetical protein
MSLGASFTKLTYVSDLSFGNFLLPNTHNFEIKIIVFTFKGQFKNTMVDNK